MTPGLSDQKYLGFSIEGRTVWEEVEAAEQNPETKDDGKLERMDVMQNASILDSLQKTSAALMAPPKAPQSPVASLPALFKTSLQ